MKKRVKISLYGLMSALLLAACSQEVEQNTSGTTSSLGVSDDSIVIEAESTGSDQDVAELFQLQEEIAEEIRQLDGVEEVFLFLYQNEDGVYDVSLSLEGEMSDEASSGIDQILEAHLDEYRFGYMEEAGEGSADSSEKLD